MKQWVLSKRNAAVGEQFRVYKLLFVFLLCQNDFLTLKATSKNSTYEKE